MDFLKSLFEHGLSVERRKGIDASVQSSLSKEREMTCSPLSPLLTIQLMFLVHRFDSLDDFLGRNDRRNLDLTRRRDSGC